MKNGLYEYKDDSIPGSGHVVIDVTETEKCILSNWLRIQVDMIRGEFRVFSKSQRK